MAQLAIKKHASAAPEATESDLKSNTTPKHLKMTLKVCDGFRPIYSGFSAHSLDKFHVGSLKSRKRYNSVSKCIKSDF